MGFPTRITSVDGQTGTVDVTKADVGLGNVDNTSDATKNTAVATLTNKTLTTPVINSPTGIVKADVGLSNVDNTSDASKPVSTAQLTAIQDRSNEVISTTWANRAAAIAAIAALVPAEGYVRVTNVGTNGSLWWCNGVKLLRDTSIIIGELTVGVILPSLVAANLATYNQTGTTITVDNTVGHNIPATTFNGNSVYLTPSSGTLVGGIFTNFQRTGATTFTCESTISQSISGNLASTTGIVTLASFTILGNLLGTTGRFETSVEQQSFGSGNTKTATYTFGGTTYYNFPNTTNTSMAGITGMRNKNATNVQQATCMSTSTGISATTGTVLTAAIDTTADAIIALKATVATANEWMCIEHASLLVYPS